MPRPRTAPADRTEWPQSSTPATKGIRSHRLPAGTDLSAFSATAAGERAQHEGASIPPVPRGAPACTAATRDAAPSPELATHAPAAADEADMPPSGAPLVRCSLSDRWYEEPDISKRRSDTLRSGVEGATEVKRVTKGAGSGGWPFCNAPSAYANLAAPGRSEATINISQTLPSARTAVQHPHEALGTPLVFGQHPTPFQRDAAEPRAQDERKARAQSELEARSTGMMATAGMRMLWHHNGMVAVNTR
jgi:hypothetical protein